MSSNVVTLTADNFDALALGSEKVAVVDFWATWCPPCRALAPAIQALAAERPDLRVGKVDVDQHPELADRYGVTSIPTVLVFRGGQVAGQSIGLIPLARLRELAGPTPTTTAAPTEVSA